ncbi:MAG TPA: hypothetical protein EYQ61_00065 [Dehalococcoidia bacterium]|nr:hypothetical protein [Dehalococcoidia bacterium]HIK89583.1 hypothetical protein [Dehalococcoidia bacterium]
MVHSTWVWGRSAFAQQFATTSMVALTMLVVILFGACTPEEEAEETAEAVQEITDEVIKAVEQGELSGDEALATAFAAEAAATAGPKATVETATDTTAAIDSREAQNELVDIADTALAEGKIDLDQFIETAEAIKGIEPETEDADTESSVEPTPSPKPESLPTATATRIPVPTLESTDAPASEYLSVGVYRSDSRFTGDPTPNKPGRNGSKGDIGLGFIELFYTQGVTGESSYDWTIEFSFGSPYSNQFAGRTITLIDRGKATGGGTAPAELIPLEMCFVSDLPPESVEIVETSGPLEIKYGATSRLEVKVTIPKGDVGDQFTLGWGLLGCKKM